MRRLSLFLALLVTLALPAATLAAHESNNKLTFAPVAESSAPDASGSGVINYIKGTSEEEPDTAWSSSFRFDGLAPNTTYVVAVKGRFADPVPFSEICRFSTNANGSGGCAEAFLGLERLAIAQLQMTDGTPVLQATRQAVVAGPGSITSDGGCREADSAGAICDAPGLE